MKIFISVALALLLLGCSSDNTQEQQTSKEVSQEKSTAQNTEEEQSEVVQATKDVKDEVVTKTEEVTQKAEEISQEVTQKAGEVGGDLAQKTKEVQETVSSKLKGMTAATSSSAQIDGKELYQPCLACHGASAEKPALGKSQIIKGWEATKIADALRGYKQGTYGGAMKGLMAPHAAKLSEDEIKAVSEYISSF